ncbi:MAG: haloacid dehalogenase-like hydrolase [Verrucomicrobiae bacterium]|nr:haloacid dehalogenase-like hydrolase [Verrucomicrobiae bacterium]
MIIGIDFDNTMVSYDRLAAVAAKRRNLIPEAFPENKTRVRDYLRAIGREADWTRLQSEIYGEMICEAEPFPGVRSFLELGHRKNWTLCIVSHKTSRPYGGGDVNLRLHALNWLEHHRFLDSSETGLTRPHVFFEETKAEKMARIGSLKCDWFIDDLPELLLEPGFPPSPQKILFDPQNQHPDHEAFQRCRHWDHMMSLIQNRGQDL